MGESAGNPDGVGRLIFSWFGISLTASFSDASLRRTHDPRTVTIIFYTYGSGVPVEVLAEMLKATFMGINN